MIHLPGTPGPRDHTVDQQRLKAAATFVYPRATQEEWTSKLGQCKDGARLRDGAAWKVVDRVESRKVEDQKLQDSGGRHRPLARFLI